MDSILQVNNLTKQYDGFKLDHVSFSVPKGAIMGLIGENGAGKSTTINAILDLIHKDEGTVTFWGQELSGSKQLKEDIGVVFDGINFYETLTPAKVGKIGRTAYKQWDAHLYQEYLKRFQLPLDIGGFTADYLLMKNGEIDLTSCDSLENGVILLYNKVRSKVNSELDLLLDEGDVDAILMGKKTQYPDAAIRLTEQMTQEFINDLFSTLRERMLDLQYCKVVFVGGGAILLKRQIETSGKVGTPFFVPKINANADGYEYLYRIETAGR